MARNTF